MRFDNSLIKITCHVDVIKTKMKIGEITCHHHHHHQYHHQRIQYVAQYPTTSV